MYFGDNISAVIISGFRRRWLENHGSH